MRKFTSGPLEGTNLEIMPSPAATTLPDGTPINLSGPAPAQLNDTQMSGVDVHARQRCELVDSNDNCSWYVWEGPSIAQQWKAEYQAKLSNRGWSARYYNTGQDPRDGMGQ